MYQPLLPCVLTSDVIQLLQATFQHVDRMLVGRAT